MSWALAVTQPRAEMRASLKLARFNFPNHVFKHEITGAFRGRFVKRLVPAFPSYLFVYVLDEMRGLLHHLWPFIGLRSFVSVDGETKVSESALNNLLSQSMPGDVLPVDNEHDARFKFGDRIQIVTGAHAAFGCEGIYQCTVKPGRVCILSPWLGQLAPIEVSESDIELVSVIKAAAQSKKRKKRGGRKRNHFHRRRSRFMARGNMHVASRVIHNC